MSSTSRCSGGLGRPTSAVSANVRVVAVATDPAVWDAGQQLRERVYGTLRRRLGSVRFQIPEVRASSASRLCVPKGTVTHFRMWANLAALKGDSGR